MRALRVDASAVQLALHDPDLAEPAEPWWDLPEGTRASILTLLARLIARSVVVDDTVQSTVEVEEPSDG